MSRPPILLVNPPSPRGRTANREGFGGLGAVEPGRRGFVYPAQFLAEAAAVLREAGVPFRAGDLVIERWRGPGRIFRRLTESAHGHDVLVKTSATTLGSDLDWIERVLPAKSHRIMLAGTALDEFSAEIERRNPTARIFLGASGQGAATVILGRDPDSGAAETWPFADWDALPLGRSRRIPLYHARGCRELCTYCPYVRATGRTLVLRSAARTAEEFSYQVRRHRPKRVVFRDPLFGADGESTRELLERLAALGNGERAPFEIETRPEMLDRAMVDRLGRAGAVHIKLGVETLNPRALLAARRVAGPAEAARYPELVSDTLALLAEFRLSTRVFLMSGLPESGPLDAQDAARALRITDTASVKAYRAPDARALADSMKR